MAEGPVRFDMHLSLRLGAMALDARLETHNSAIAVVGPSGSGKSTLLRVLAGVEHGATGHLRVDDETWQDSAAGVFVQPWDRRVGWVPQDALLFPHLSVRENLAYAGASDTDVVGMASLLRVEDLLDRRPRRLSGGRAAAGRSGPGPALRATPSVAGRAVFSPRPPASSRRHGAAWGVLC